VRREEKKQNNKGFSLVELIIVIAIMAVLVAILAPAFMRYAEEFRQKADITAVKEIIQAAKAAYTSEEWSLSGTAAKATITMQKGSTITIDNSSLEAALKSSDVDNPQLKSSKWGSVTIEFTEATNGGLHADVKSTGDVKMEDKYNKK